MEAKTYFRSAVFSLPDLHCLGCVSLRLNLNIFRGVGASSLSPIVIPKTKVFISASRRKMAVGSNKRVIITVSPSIFSFAGKANNAIKRAIHAQTCRKYASV